MGMLVYTDQPQQGEPVLPVTRHIQVEWEWCPMTSSASDTAMQPRSG